MDIWSVISYDVLILVFKILKQFFYNNFDSISKIHFYISIQTKM